MNERELDRLQEKAKMKYQKRKRRLSLSKEQGKKAGIEELILHRNTQPRKNWASISAFLTWGRKIRMGKG